MLANIPNLKHLETGNFFMMAGPCVVESEEMTRGIAASLKELTDKLKIPFIFKASYRKANRTRLDSFTGIGDQQALEILGRIRNDFQVPVVTDIHESHEAAEAAAFVDVLQIPAFLCRQTDLLVAAAKTGKMVNVKKGQFLAAASMKFAVNKIRESGNQNICLTERGTMLGYTDLVVDFRGISVMKEMGTPVILDITHSLQQPNQGSGVTGGQPHLISTIASAGIAVGVDGIFVETHPDPANALSDGANMLPLNQMENMLNKLLAIHAAVRKF
ncbi:MAG: 3-deoxy-8-phosphooctulonate synthase [Bacteroidetes bacterium]|nr:3-deoxy-8-phosphooctulonate synthase [Bacteroidota bacterium]MBK7969976.1 3-deoxy-8-phosphooctulonate synthase [Bacteroidota bacterium]MBK9048130.1 3-deoxy-8-phosphooctulonate synthase [Bacteroidota bacterium]MBK9425243.1 3-deoxy-8-phosphooctulonate synthase [Bacteroidota bacterium]